MEEERGGGGGGGGRSGGGGGGYESAAGGDMANIAVQRIKREFKEVLKSEEVRDELRDAPLTPFPAAIP